MVGQQSGNVAPAGMGFTLHLLLDAYTGEQLRGKEILVVTDFFQIPPQLICNNFFRFWRGQGDRLIGGHIANELLA